MVEYRPADLTPGALAAIQRLEQDLGLSLVAYAAAEQSQATRGRPRRQDVDGARRTIPRSGLR
ncbi:MAG TPA: hypothetical protein VNM16_02590 [Bacillota bacterium]|nr:hypothetical protein [Bacillota bacterium]